MSPRIAATALAGVFAFPAPAQPITYQGSLTHDQRPADGLYDMNFRLHDGPSGGSPLSDPVELTGVEVAGGLFTVLLPFPAGTWDGLPGAVYLETSVAPADTGGFETLAPRQRITPAPLAVSALHHPIELINPLSGPTLSNPGPVARLLLNRDTPVSPGDFLGVEVPASAGPFGGMVVSHADPLGLPYYAYASGGLVTSFTYHEPGSDEWRLSNAGDKLSVDPLGNVEATIRFVAPEFAYDDPKPRTMSVSFSAFNGSSPSNWEFINFGAGSKTGTFNTGYAPLSLPDGATVTNIVFYFRDDESVDLQLMLIEKGHTGGLDPVATLTTSGDFQGIRSLEAAGRGFSPFTVDNDAHHYFFQLTTVNNTQWFGNLEVTSVEVHYTVPEPD
ncbi:MAG: hypothetical protein ACF8Q5_07715 [Phycisphaerales bacterium JB040]